MHRIGVQHSTYIDKYQQKQLGTFLRRKQLKYFTAFMQMQIKRWSRTYTVSLVTAMKRSICSHSPNILESHLTIVLIAWHRCWTSVHVSYYINADKWSTCSQPSLILTRGPFQLSSAKYVQVKMVYRLTCWGTTINDNSKTIYDAFFLRYYLGSIKEVAQYIFMSLFSLSKLC